MPWLLALLLCLASFPASAKTLVVLGDSLTEGYGVEKEKAFPALLEQKLNARKKESWKVVNSGFAGATSASGAGRLDWVLQTKPDAILIALGANDGLRGIKPSATKDNLRRAIRAAKEKKLQVFLAGMEMPPNLGKEYRAEFRAVYPSLAKEEKVPLLAFLLEGVGGKPNLNQADGIHPNEEGHRLVAEHVYQFLKGRL